MSEPRSPTSSAESAPRRAASGSLSDEFSSEAPDSLNNRVCPSCGRRFPAAFRVCPHDATPLEDAPESEDPMLGQVLGGSYEVLRVLGQGGMGKVYEARHQRLGSKRFAIKMLHPELARQPEVVTRFQREAEASSVLSHPNVVDVYDVNTSADGRPYIVAELLVGEELGLHLDRVQRLPAARAVHIVRQVALALGAAHDRGIVHRDVKPENVFLTGVDGFVKVLDFGISKLGENSDGLTKTGTVMGTPDYMAPEQARGDRVDARADVYALGAILYRAVTGRKPFEGLDPMATLTAVLTQEPPRPTQLVPDIPLPLELVIQRAMAKQPGERFQTMLELDAALAPFDTEPPPPSSSAKVRTEVSVTPVLLRRTAATVPSQDLMDAGRSVRLARPSLVFFTALGALWALANVLMTVVSLLRLMREGGADDLTAPEVTLTAVGALAALGTPVALWIRHLAREVWPSTPRALAVGMRLRRTVLYSAAASGITALTIQIFEVVVQRHGAGVARPGWQLVCFLVAFAVAAGNWMLSRPRTPLD